MIDKSNIISDLQQGRKVAIELGCGNGKKNSNAIGIDALDYPCVDIVGDVFEVLAKFPDHSVDNVYAYHFVEHVANLQGLMQELQRVCASNARIVFVAPHFSNPYFFSDPTHHNFFGLYTFCYYIESKIFRRRVPTYGVSLDFTIESVDLIFKSDTSFPVRYGIRRLIGTVLNVNTYMREFYEENISSIISCYEVRYVLKKR